MFSLKNTNRQKVIISTPPVALLMIVLIHVFCSCTFDPAGIPDLSGQNNENTDAGIHGFCGNNIAEPGEACDGTDLAGETCISQGFQGGDLACLEDCSGFDVSGCTGTGPVCGNNIREGAEVCDGTDLAGQTCISLGYNFGDLACLEDCSGFDTSGCNSSVCGNNIAEYGEVCDGTDLKGETCETQGFASGNLACLEDCSGFDTSGCTGPGPVCGNNVREGDEECDGTDLGGLNTCADHGCRSNGTVTCNPDCTFNISACLSGHDEDGDGIDDNCDNCPSYYNPDQADANSDGIGDVCEYPGDEDMLSEIVVFDPFLNDESSWTVSESGTWIYDNGEVIGSRTGGGANYLHDYFVPIDVSYAVETTFYYDQDSPSDSSWTALIFAWVFINSNLYAYECVLDRDNNHLGFWRISGGASWVLIDGAFFASGAQNHHWRKLHTFYDENIVECRYQDETGVTATISLSAGNVWSDMSGQAGLRVFNERAVFTSFVIYR